MIVLRCLLQDNILCKRYLINNLFISLNIGSEKILKLDIKKGSTKDKIIIATLNIINEEGFKNVTIRKIAVKADINVASVNYHFGSKENMVAEALKYLLDEFKTSFKHLKDTSQPPCSRLRNFMQSYADTAVQYPDVMKIFVDQAMFGILVPENNLKFMRNEGFEAFKNTIGEIRKLEDDSVLFMKFFQMFSCIAFPVLMGSNLEKYSELNYSNREIRNEYIELVLRNIIA